VAGHRWESEAHRALADTQATRTVWRWLACASLRTPPHWLHHDLRSCEFWQVSLCISSEE